MIKIDEKKLQEIRENRQESLEINAIRQLSQLIEAITNFTDEEDAPRVQEEIADVLIAIENLKHAYGITDDTINGWINYKLIREGAKARYGSK